jgi:lysozyme
MQKLRDMLRRHEGVKNKVYLCSAGYETIGVGRNISKSGLGLTDDEIDYLLDNDIIRCIKELNSNLTWFSNLNEAREHAIIDICFNLGITRLLKFKNALAAMANSQWDEAANEFYDSRWAKQVGDRAVTICEMIRTGKYGT